MLIVATHHKCASNPLTRVLKTYAKAKNLRCLAVEGGEADEVPSDCRILVVSNATSRFCRRFSAERPVHVFRNPLDIVVSAYYSHLRTHDIRYWPELARQRKVLERLTREQGMLSTAQFLERPDFNARVMGPLAALRTWDFDDPSFANLRMEDLVTDPFALLCAAAPGALGADAAPFFEDMRFERLSGGRAPGELDNFSHFRSGLPNQWLEELPRDLAVSLAETFRPMLERFYPDTLRLLDADHRVARAKLRVLKEKIGFWDRLLFRRCPTRDI